jgi:hypothetical protein
MKLKMALSLNKKISLLAALVCVCGSLSMVSQNSQTGEDKTDGSSLEHDPTDYKDPKQFEKFGKRRAVVGSWQINQLKTGALVVRLKTNKKLIDALKKDGNNDMAAEKEREQYAINKHTMFAYMDFMKFCKVYFIYSNSSDSLLGGTKKGIFLDTNLVVDPRIEMKEKFYMIAERDYAYNSSIGFVPEDSAKLVVEKGNPTKEMAIVIKNKYNQQVKAPFPYCIKEKSTVDAYYNLPINSVTTPDRGMIIVFPVNKTYIADLKDPAKKNKEAKHNDNQTTVKVPVELTYERIAAAVDQLNDYLVEYYRANPNPDIDRMDPGIRPFLY